MKMPRLLHWLLLLLGTVACKDKYVAKTSYPYTGYLVVDGFIEAGGGTTEFKLSRTTALDSATHRSETGAVVSVESENNEFWTLSEVFPGDYVATALPIQPSARYRLRVTTAGAREYLSQFTSVHITPPIDSVSWKEKNNGVQFYVSAHDAQGSTVYYKWRFDETWKYSARFFSSLLWDPSSPYGIHNFRYRTEDELVNTCWKSDTSSDILLGSTAKLAADVLSSQPVTFISYSESPNKLFNRYTIQVYLEALSADEYLWYDKLRKNTESLGSIFDAQPSELSGNIQGVTDPHETVIGWVGSHTVTRKRIFVGRQELLSNPLLSRGYENCLADTLMFGRDDPQIEGRYSTGINGLADVFYSPPGSSSPAGVIGSSVFCSDCREMGGVLTKPDFWQE